MKIIFADCSAVYTGRGDSKLARATRAIILKNDGSVSIHNEVGNKPMNYMKNAEHTPTQDSDGNAVWEFDSRRESLKITLYEIFGESEYDLVPNDPGLERDGTEKHLQEWLAKHPEYLGLGYSIVGSEYPTGNGPVDILAIDANGNPVAVEVKRTAMVGAVDQCRRYLDSFKDPSVDHGPAKLDYSTTQGMIAAVDIRPKTLEWAAKHSIMTVTVPSNWRKIA